MSGNAFIFSDSPHFLSFCFNNVSGNSYNYSKTSKFACKSKTFPRQHETPQHGYKAKPHILGLYPHLHYICTA